MSNYKVAICGAGFIGGSLLRWLVANGTGVNVLDHNNCPDEFTSCTRWIRGDFSDKEALRETLDGDEDVDSIKELSENLFATLEFLKICRSCGVRRVVFVSSASVYGLQLVTPIPETAATNPISSHGIQKLAIEKYLLLQKFIYGLDVRIVRLSNPYGPGQDIYGRQGFIAMAIGQLRMNRAILLRGNGAPVRDFVFIDDVSKALSIVGTAKSLPPILNIGSGIGYSIKQVVAMFEDIIGEPIATINGEARKVDIPTSVLDISLARASINFQIANSLREGLIKTLYFHNVLLSSSP
jgi:UDP-glucose 4-epimerase